MNISITDQLGNAARQEKIFSHLARIAAEAFCTPVGAITVRLVDRSLLIGRHGLWNRELSADHELGSFADAPLLFEDLQRETEPRLAPLQSGDRPLRFFASAPIFNERFRRIGLVSVADHQPRSPDKHHISTLLGIADIVGELLYKLDKANNFEEYNDYSCSTSKQNTANSVDGFGESAASSVLDRHSIAEIFLLDTLIERKSILSRNAVSYLSLRAWRKPVKKHQIAALREIKAAPSPAFIDTVSQEITGGLDRLVGERPARFVTYIPCGHSRMGDCLSALLAKQIAVHLNLPLVSVFKPNFSTGTSHPKANLVRPAMEIDTRIVDPVLLIDDVASSGRHMEEAIGLLRQSTDVVLPVAWIAGNASADCPIV